MTIEVGRANMLKGMLADPAALYGVATRVAQGAAGLITAAFIVRYFSPAVQGFYYTFATVLALQIFLELGLSGVVSIFAAHEWAKLSLDQSGAIRGDQNALGRLTSLTRYVFRWYFYGGLLLLVLLVFIGLWFFGASQDTEAVSWKYPWLAMCVLAAINFFITPAWALLTGCGQLASLNAYRVLDTAIRYGALWGCMAWGASLWSVAVATVISTIAGFSYLAIRYRQYFKTLLDKATVSDFNWRRDVAPLQKRYAIGWLGGYFAFSIFTPVMFYFHGAEEAGRLGMTWAVVSGLTGVAGTWLQVQTPKFAMMVARKEFGELDRVAWRTTLIGVLIFVAGSCVGLAALWLLELHRPAIAGRLTPVGPIVVFLVAGLIQQVSMVQSTYLRSFKQEPFLGISLVSGFVIGGGTIVLTPAFGAYGAAASYLAGMMIALLWGSSIFVRKRRLWVSSAP